MTLLLDMDDRSWIWLGNLCYAAAFAFALVSVVRSKQHSRLLLFLLVVAGFLLQTTGLYLRGLETRSCPLGNPFEILQFITWSLVVIYLAVGPAFRMSLLGFFSSGLAAGLGILSLVVSDWDAVRRVGLFGDNVWIELHAALAIFSYGAFGILALTSIMYLLQNYSLKHKKLAGIFGFLPSLYQLEQMNLRLLALGVAILSTSLLIGSVHWLGDVERLHSIKLPFTTAVWLAYLTVLVLRLRQKLISRPLAWTCIALYFLALLSIPPVDAGRRPLEPEIVDASSTAEPSIPTATDR
jgi:HemX protein